MAEVADVDSAVLREWRAFWTFNPATQQLRFVLLKRFLGFALDTG